MKTQYEIRRTKELRARFERMRREVEALEALPDVTGEFEPVDPMVFADISAVLDEQSGVQSVARVRWTCPPPRSVRC